ncbi:methyltransferase domain-containing protein [Nitratireductor sp. XY-223]|uniref:methyltransferase domain-containing protein n=1 Tax=Nitratireductor sp. XY-223 TaxID=2561926 RepID=UPI0010AA647C|nr:methyltransferase domain-containing protein [Nitratireductor sp. XY-223]
MTDPFQNVEAGGAEFIETVVGALETRAGEPVMVEIVERYLDELDFIDGGLHVEIGAGTGAIARRIATRAVNGQVIASEPSAGLVEAARKLADGASNLKFETGDGAALRFEDGSVDNVVMHTVLSHVVEPAVLLNEAFRILKHGGRLAVCDADFEKTSLANALADPLDACAKYFAEHFVTDKFLTGKLRGLVKAAGLTVEQFRITSRTITAGMGGMTWVGMASMHMVKSGLIGQELADALAAEYKRRESAGALYGHQPFVTLVARKP